MIELIRKIGFALKKPIWRRALLVAVLSDILGFFVVLTPPLQWAIDAVTAVLLVVILGFRWKLLLAMAIEVIPAIQLFPAWTLVIIAMAGTEEQNSTDNGMNLKKLN